MLYLDPTASQHPQQRQRLRADRWWTDIVRSVFGEATPNGQWQEYFMHAHMWTPIETQPIQFILMISNFVQIDLQTAEQSAQSFAIDTHSENSHQTKLREESSIGLPLMLGLLPFSNPVLFSCQTIVQFATSDSFIRWAQIWCREVAMSGSKPAVDPCMTPVTLSRGTDQDLITNHYAIVWSTFAANWPRGASDKVVRHVVRSDLDRKLAISSVGTCVAFALHKVIWKKFSS